MSKDRVLVENEKQLNDIIKKDGYYYTALSKGRFEYVVNCILSLYFKECGDLAKAVLEQVNKAKLMKKKKFYNMYSDAAKELNVDKNFSLEQIKTVDNVKNLIKYISGLYTTLKPVFRALEMQTKKNPIIKKWIKHNETICLEAVKCMKNVDNLVNNIKSYNKIKTFSFRKTLVQPMQSDREIILFFLQTTLTKDPDDKKASVPIKNDLKVSFNMLTLYKPKEEKETKTSSQENHPDIAEVGALPPPPPPPPPPPGAAPVASCNPIEPVEVKQSDVNKRIKIIALSKSTVDKIEQSFISALRGNNKDKVISLGRTSLVGEAYGSKRYKSNFIFLQSEKSKLSDIKANDNIYYRYIYLKDLSQNIKSGDENSKLSLCLGLLENITLSEFNKNSELIPLQSAIKNRGINLS